MKQYIYPRWVLRAIGPKRELEGGALNVPLPMFHMKQYIVFTPRFKYNDTRERQAAADAAQPISHIGGKQWQE